MKHLAIARLRKGVETQSKAFALFLNHGPPANAEWTLASADSQTYVTLIDGEPDLVNAAMFAPHMDLEFMPVIEAGEEWVEAMQTAMSRQT